MTSCDTFIEWIIELINTKYEPHWIQSIYIEQYIITMNLLNILSQELWCKK